MHHGIALGIIGVADFVKHQLDLHLQVAVRLGSRHQQEARIAVGGQRQSRQVFTVAVLVGVPGINPFHHLVAREGNLQHSLFTAFRAGHDVVGLESSVERVVFNNRVGIAVNQVPCVTPLVVHGINYLVLFRGIARTIRNLTPVVNRVDARAAAVAAPGLSVVFRPIAYAVAGIIGISLFIESMTHPRTTFFTPTEECTGKVFVSVVTVTDEFSVEQTVGDDDGVLNRMAREATHEIAVAVIGRDGSGNP